MKALGLIALLISASMASGCATIVHWGTHQNVDVSSDPAGAQVIVDNNMQGVTPVTFALKRNELHNIVVKKEGFEDNSTRTDKEFSYWIVGNILIGGAIGLIVDLAGGSGFNITPEKVFVNLKTNSQNPPLSSSTQPTTSSIADSTIAVSQ